MRTSITTGSRVAIGIVTSAALVAGCAGAAKDSTDSAKKKSEELYVNGFVGDADGSEDPKNGGTLTVGEFAEARSLDPTKTLPNGAVGGNALAAVYDTLMRYDSEAEEFVPGLAKSMTSDDDTVWTLELRDNVTFSDGTPLNSAAVLGSVGYYMKNRGYNVQLLAENIADMKPDGDQKVVFTLRKPWHGFPSLFANGAGMVLAPAAYQDPANFKPIGAGAFELESYKPAEELLLTARKDYWDGAPHLDKVRFVFLASDQARLESLKAGEIDTAYLRGPEVVEKARADYRGNMAVLGGGSTLAINNREGRPGSDVRVRQAINHAIDRDLWMQRSNGDHGLPTASLIPEIWKSYRKVDADAYDPEKAKELLDAAKADGYDGKIEYMGQSDQQSKAAAVAVEAMLEKVGFEVSVNLLRSVTDQTTKLFVDHDYDLSTSAMSLGEDDPFGRLSSQLGSKSPANPFGYADPEMDTLVGQLQGIDDADQRADVLAKINEHWQETVPALVMSSGATFYPWGKDVHGLEPTAESIVLLQDAWKG